MPRPPLLLALALTACVPKYGSVEEAYKDGATIKHSPFDQLANNEWSSGSAKPVDATRRGVVEHTGTDASAVYGYGVSIAQFYGIDRLSKAKQCLTDHHLWGQATLTERDGVLDLMVGHWPRTDDPNLLKALAKWQRMTLGKEQPFRYAMIRNRISERTPTEDPLDAANYVGFQSLLIGIYTEKTTGKSRKKEVERIVKILRKQGPSDGLGPVDAMYRHSDTESVILVGLFTRKDHWVNVQQTGTNAQIESPGPVIQNLMRRLPHMIEDGHKKPANGNNAGPPWEPSSLSELH